MNTQPISTVVVLPRDHSVIDREAERRDLWAKMDAFLAKGGSVNNVPPAREVIHENGVADHVARSAQVKASLDRLPEGPIRTCAVMLARGSSEQHIRKNLGINRETFNNLRARIHREFRVGNDENLALVMGVERVEAQPDRKRCKRCSEWKALDDFPKCPACRGGRAGSCRACERTRALERRQVVA